MAKIQPNDEAICTAAATLAAKLADLRDEKLRDMNAPAQESALISYYRWALDELLLEHRGGKGS